MTGVQVAVAVSVSAAVAQTMPPLKSSASEASFHVPVVLKLGSLQSMMISPEALAGVGAATEGVVGLVPVAVGGSLAASQEDEDGQDAEERDWFHCVAP